MKHFRNGSVAQITDDIKTYGKNQYAAGKSAAYLSIYKLACETLVKAEQSENPLCIFSNFLDELEQIKAISG